MIIIRIGFLKTGGSYAWWFLLASQPLVPANSHVALLPALPNHLAPPITWPVSHRASSNAAAVENDRMVKIELEAAEALAGLAYFPTNVSESGGSDSVHERVKDESNSSFVSNSYYEGATNFMVKDPEKSGVLTATKSMKDEHRTELRLNPTLYSANCGRKSRQNLTEAEIEARKIRRVLANRESARQTIRRRQAVFEELTRKAVDLAWENENLKREKDKSLKHYDSLKMKNECLKAQMIKVMNHEVEETREESITTSEPTISTSSTNSPFIIYNQQPFLPFVWPNSVQLQCGPPAGLVFPSHIPISATNKPTDSSCSEQGSPLSINGSGTPLYLLPYPWLVTLPQNSNENRPRSFNLNDRPKEEQFFPEKPKAETPTNFSCFPPDGGGRDATDDHHPVSCHEEFIEQNDDTCNTFLTEHLKDTTVGENNKINVGEIHKIHQVPVVCSGKRSGDIVAAATEARKRRKELTRLKNHFQTRQLRMH